MLNQERLRLGMLTATVSPAGGGVAQVVREVAAALSASETIDARIVSISPGDTVWETENDAECDAIVAPAQRTGIVARVPDIVDVLTSLRLDVVHTHGLWTSASIATRAWRRRTKRPYIVSAHGMLDPWALISKRWKKRIARLIYEDKHLRGSACLHALCDAEVEAYRRLGLDNPICIVPNGIRGIPTAVDGSAPWPPVIADGRHVLLFLSRLHEKKGIEHLLKAFRLVHKRAHHHSPVWSLVIAGWGEPKYVEYLHRLSRELQVEITFLGPVFGDIKRRALAHADAFVLPSLSEGMPVAVLEAWSHGLPVVLTQQCNIPRFLSSKAAIVANPGVDGLVASLEVLFEMSATQRKTMGAAGRQLVGERFLWSQVTKQLEDVYGWVVGGGSPPACVQLT